MACSEAVAEHAVLAQTSHHGLDKMGESGHDWFVRLLHALQRLP
jgi:hypothetical protein